MPNYVDLHIHTTASDGTYTPGDLVRYAEESGLSAIAITDHDSISGLAEAHSAAVGLDIEVIDGVEFDCDYTRVMHMLGYYIDPYAAVFQGALHQLKVWRAERNEEMIERLRALGIDISREDVLAKRTDGDMSNAGRLNIALAMVEKNVVADVNEAFEKYLLKGGLAYVERRCFSPQKSIEIIKSAGGYAFFAHPIQTESDPDKLCVLVERLVEYGLDGIECYHAAQDEAFCDMCVTIANKYNLMVSGGSDFHGTNRPEMHVGQVGDGRYIEYGVLYDIKSRLGII